MKISLRLRPWLIVALVAIGGLMFWRNGWLSDDSYITFRSVAQLRAGHGPVWNSYERVQVFTHPLWFCILSAVNLIWSNIYLASLTLSALIGGLALYLARRATKSDYVYGLLFLTLLSSKIFVTYWSSGLETPLSYLLLTIFWLLTVRRPARLIEGRWILLITLIYSLLLLTRLDFCWLLTPVLLWSYWRVRHLGARRLMGSLVLGLLPLLIWMSFSLVYYGFALPNTAYAKIGTGIPSQLLRLSGLVYAVVSGIYDPLALVLVGGALYLALRRRRAVDLLWATGLVVQILYIISVGGDFMVGRFLAPLVIIAALQVFHDAPKRSEVLWLVIGVAVVINLASPAAPWRGRTHYEEHFGRILGVTDEQDFYYQASALSRYPWRDRSHVYPDYQLSAWAVESQSESWPVITYGMMGMLGYFSRLDQPIVDWLALTDPLLARLPMKAGYTWMPGHYERTIPAGYLDTAAQGRNLIEDPDLHQYYDALSLITRGPIWSKERWRTIIDFNLGRYDYLRQAYINRLPRPEY